MLFEFLDLNTVMKIRDYEILKRFIKKEIEDNDYISVDKIRTLLEVLEEKEERNDDLSIK